LNKTFPYTIFPLGDSALVLEFGNEIDIPLNQYISHLFKKVKQAGLNYITDVVPAYTSLAVHYNLLQVPYHREKSSFEIVAEKITTLVKMSGTNERSNTGKLILLPVCYSPKYGIDLLELAEKNKMEVEHLVSVHSSKLYHVFMIGFLPGFAYMGEVDASIATARKSTPRQEVVEGSIGIAGKQTGIYTISSPGGWNIVGRTPEQLFKKHLEIPVLIHQGDRVKFIPITEDEYENY
jgi:inhibitor of KinA